MLLATLLVAVAAVVVVFQVSGSAPTANTASGDQVVIEPTTLDLPDSPSVLIFGDSWTYGSAASDPTLGYAYVIAGMTGWNTIVDGVRASGYLRPGIDGPDFGTRIAQLDIASPDLIIVQGSINDRKLPAAGYRDAVNAAWDRLEAKYPDSEIVILGPAPQVLPVEDATARIDRDLQELASFRGWWYISPIQEEWITTADYDWIIDTSKQGNNHPSDEGHIFLAEHVAEAIDAISR